MLVVHVGIDGFIRLTVFCRWSANIQSLTVLNLFKEAEDQYGLPLPVRRYCIVLSNVVTPTRKSLEFKHASQ